MRILARASCVLLLALLATPLLAQGRIDAQLPQDTLVLITCPDLSKSWDNFQKSALFDIWKEPSVQKLYEKLRGILEKEADKQEQVKNFRKEFKEKVGIELEDLPKVFFQGEFALALVDLEMKKEGPPKVDLLLTFDYGKEGEKFGKLRKFLLEQIEKEGKVKPTTSKIGDVEVTKLASEDMPFAIHLASKDNRFYVSTQEATLKRLLEKGSVEQTLAKHAQYVESRKGVNPETETAFFYLNLAALWKRMGDQVPPDAKKIMESIGVFGIDTVAAGTGFDGKTLRDHVFIGIPGARKGIQKIFTLPKNEMKTLKYAPAGAASYGSYAIDLKGIYDEAMTIFRSVAEKEFRDFSEQKKGAEEKLGMKIEDLVGALGTELAAIARLPKAEAGAKLSLGDLIRATYILSLKDEAKVSAAITKLIELAEAKDKVKVEEAHGWKINVLAMPQEGDVPLKSIGWAIKDGHLFIGLPAEDLKLLAKEQSAGEPGLASVAAFQAELKRFPEGMSGFGYTDLAAYVRALWAMGKPYIEDLLKDEKAPIKPADLPDMDAIAKHLSPMTGAYYSDQAGLRIVSRSPVGSLTTVAIAGIAAAIAVPGVARAREGAKGTACLAQLKQVGAAIKAFEADQAKLPEDLAELVSGQKKYLEGSPFKCPSDPFPQREGQIETSYIYIYSNKLGKETPEKTILAYDKSPLHGGSRTVLFLDGSVQSVPDFKFRELFNEQKERLKKHGIQVFIGWGKLK